jgi:hypothetical protein
MFLLPGFARQLFLSLKSITRIPARRLTLMAYGTESLKILLATEEHAIDELSPVALESTDRQDVIHFECR